MRKTGFNGNNKTQKMMTYFVYASYQYILFELLY